MRLNALGLVAIVTVSAAPALAAAPQALYNKSIVMHWSEGRATKYPDGSQRHIVVNSAYTVYISNQGRMFSIMGRERLNARGKTVTQKGVSRGPDGSKIVTAGQSYGKGLSFDGKSMHAMAQFESGARRISASFDDGFRGCSLNVSYGKEDNAPGHVMHGMTGRLIMVTKIDIVGASCSVKDGNAFGE
jgi:hypothetical protein